MTTFELANGTVTGRSHRKSGKNNQDGFRIIPIKDGFIAIVTDGCGSAPHSEVGAKIGAHIAAKAIANCTHLPASTGLLAASGMIKQQILTLARNMGANPNRIIADHFLFTIIGIMVQKDTTTAFFCGDGMIQINDKTIILNPQEGNTPIYIAYDLVPTSLKDVAPESMTLQVAWQGPTSEVKHFLIGTDGAENIIKRADCLLPGKHEVVGGIDQFWTNDRFYKNPEAINRRLRIMNRDGQKVDWPGRRITRFSGLLEDDTTIICGRKTASK